MSSTLDSLCQKQKENLQRFDNAPSSDGILPARSLSCNQSNPVNHRKKKRIGVMTLVMSTRTRTRIRREVALQLQQNARDTYEGLSIRQVLSGYFQQENYQITEE